MAVVRVACVGDSITLGAGTTPDPEFTNAYPAILGRMLGPDWEIRSFGVGGTTALKRGDFPYITTSAFEQAKAFLPDIVVLMLGTNDTKPQNWAHQWAFIGDYRALVKEFQNLNSAPRVLICRPCFVCGSGNFGINQEAVEELVVMLDRVARDLALEVVDVQGATRGRMDLFPDRVHPNNAGAEVIAQEVYRAITGKEWPGGTMLV
jgi:lysophospholipase L1-like esterase